MKPLKINFQNTYAELPDAFFQKIAPTKVKSPKLISWNSDLAEFFNLYPDLKDKITVTEISEIFSGNKIVPESLPIATAYSGHQFGQFNPTLGDGRAHLIGELKGKDGQLYDIQLKGSGQTQYSRSGDGRSPLGPVLREYVVSEAMHCLGVATTRSLAAVETGEVVFREEPLSGGILTRVAKSLIRIGTFEHFASRAEIKNIQILLEYLVQRAYPEIIGAKDLPLEFFKSLLHKQAQLVAHWMSLGFIHGVMNTDNTSALGITIDYGPCAFLDETDFNKVFSSIDHQGRYSYGNQPQILQWNLTRLAEALLLLYDEAPDKPVIENFQEELNNFASMYETEWRKLMYSKLGLTNTDETIRAELLSKWMAYLESNKIDYTLGFRNLPTLLGTENKDSIFKETKEFLEFATDWKSVIMANFESVEDATKHLNSKNPFIIPRNHIIEQIISDGYNQNFDRLNKFLEALKNPFEYQEKFKEFSLPPKDSEKVRHTFCGT